MKALDISRKMPLISNPSSKPLKISWVIATSWLMQESPGLKQDLKIMS